MYTYIVITTFSVRHSFNFLHDGKLFLESQTFQQFLLMIKYVTVYKRLVEELLVVNMGDEIKLWTKMKKQGKMRISKHEYYGLSFKLVLFFMTRSPFQSRA